MQRGQSGRDQESNHLLRSIAQAVKPYRSGSLDQAPLSHLFVFLENHRLSGSLWVVDPGQDSTVQFVRGAPAKARSTLVVPHLGELLVELGYIDQRAYDETIDFALRGGGLHGAMLVACGKLESSALHAGLREQTALRLIELFRNAGQHARFAFYRDVDLLASWGGPELTPVDPYWVLWWGTRDRPHDEHVSAALELIAREALLLRRDVDWDRFAFDREAQRFLTWWGEHPATVDQLLAYAGMPENRIANLIVALFLTRSLAYAETRPAPAPVAPKRPPMDSVTDLFVRRSPVEPEVPSQVEKDEHVSVDLDEEVEFPAEEWDDPAVGSDEPDEQQTTGANDRMRQAFQTLLDSVEQESAIEPLPARGPTHSELDLARSAEAMQWSSRCHTALRDGEFEEAERCAGQALALLPENAVLKTDYAWAASLLPSRRKIGDMGDLLDLLKEATATDPQLDRPYYVRGTIFEHLGLHREAYAEYRAAFARNASNADAATKIREYVRRAKDTGSLEPGGKPYADQTSPMAIPAKAGALLAKLWKRG